MKIVSSLWSRWLRFNTDHPVAGLLLGYFGLSCLLCWELLGPGRSLYRWDTLLYNWPMLIETRAQLLAGHFPFWTSSFCGGTPLLGNINAGVLYPLRWICWLLPVRVGYQFFVFVHVWLGLWGMHLFLRRGLRLRSMQAFVGALAFGMSGYARGMWDTHNFMALPWIPLGLYAVLLGRQLTSVWFPSVCTAFCLSLLILCGDFQAACVWIPVALLLAILVPGQGKGASFKTLAMGILLAGLLTAPQWIPAWRVSMESYRGGGLDLGEATERSLHPLRLVEMVVPNVFGTHGEWFASSLAGENARKPLPWTASVHIGRLALLAALFAFHSRRRFYVRWSALLLIVSVCLSFGRFLPGFQYWLSIPVVGMFRYPEKYMLWSTVALALLAAVGSGRLCAAVRVKARRPIHIAVILGIATTGFVGLSVFAINAAKTWPVWLTSRCLETVIVFTFFWLITGRRRALWALVALFLLDEALPWNLERTTTSRFDPTEMPVIAEVIKTSAFSNGRFARDPAVAGAPVRVAQQDLTPSEESSRLQTALLDFNSGRLWGVRLAGGFSPTESGISRRFREQNAAVGEGVVPGPERFAEYCKALGVQWILTTSDRAATICAALRAEPVDSWGPERETVLLLAPAASEAFCRLPSTSADRSIPAAPAARQTPVVNGMWRKSPGNLRVDLQPGDAAILRVAETYAAGWTARDQDGRILAMQAAPEGLMDVEVPAGTLQVRFNYVPSGWRVGSICGFAGVLLTLLCVFRALWQTRVRNLFLRPAFCVAVCCACGLGVGLVARDHWSCTFDEGFHLARGVARLQTGDARLSYFHPPLQNVAGAYFANLAVGERLTLPTGTVWSDADVARYATVLAAENREVFVEAVRASRTGSQLFGVLLAAVITLWAFQMAGPLAGWLAGVGMAFNPNILAHSNLTTTDAGFAAFAVLGSFLVWTYARSAGVRFLFWAAVAFSAAAMCKHTGLIWWISYLFLAVPLWAVSRRNIRLLWLLPFGVAVFFMVLISLYGPIFYAIRHAGPNGGWIGGDWIGGRYVEGILWQGQHAMEGHRSYFAGQRFIQGEWWHSVAALGLKWPPAWLLAGVIGLGAAMRAARRPGDWIPWIPAASFAILAIFVNRIAIGVRHLLPLMALGTLSAAVWCARLPGVARRGMATLLMVTAIGAALWSYPDFISYYPAWTGGSDSGHRWAVDSNYDWGQELDDLEQNWAALTLANRGVPPHLLYFGFVDPVVVYGMKVASPSLNGYMGRSLEQEKGDVGYAAWTQSLSRVQGSVVSSISALRLHPYSLNLDPVSQASELGWIGRCFRISRTSSPPGDKKP